MSERIVLKRMKSTSLVEIHCLVEPRIVHGCRPLTHLNANVIKLLHSKELSQVAFALFLAVLDIVDVFQPEFFKFDAQGFDGVLELLHQTGVLFDESLDRVDFQVEGHLDWSEQLSDDITDHLASDVVEFVVKICLLEHCNSPQRPQFLRSTMPS